nr:hypothetical protein [Actinomadura pelletieri]
MVTKRTGITGLQRPGDRDDRRRMRRVGNAPIKITGHRGNRQIEHDNIGTPTRSSPRGPRRIGLDLHVEALTSQVPALHLGDRRVMLDDEDDPVAAHARPFR